MIVSENNEKMNDNLNELGKLAEVLYNEISKLPNREEGKAIILESKNSDLVITISRPNKETKEFIKNAGIDRVFHG